MQNNSLEPQQHGRWKTRGEFFFFFFFVSIPYVIERADFHRLFLQIEEVWRFAFKHKHLLQKYAQKVVRKLDTSLTMVAHFTSHIRFTHEKLQFNAILSFVKEPTLRISRTTLKKVTLTKAILFSNVPLFAVTKVAQSLIHSDSTRWHLKFFDLARPVTATMQFSSFYFQRETTSWHLKSYSACFVRTIHLTLLDKKQWSVEIVLVRWFVVGRFVGLLLVSHVLHRLHIVQHECLQTDQPHLDCSTSLNCGTVTRALGARLQACIHGDGTQPWEPGQRTCKPTLGKYEYISRMVCNSACFKFCRNTNGFTSNAKMIKKIVSHTKQKWKPEMKLVSQSKISLWMVRTLFKSQTKMNAEFCWKTKRLKDRIPRKEERHAYTLRTFSWDSLFVAVHFTVFSQFVLGLWLLFVRYVLNRFRVIQN